LAFSNHASSWKVAIGREAPAGLEVGFRVALQALDTALGLRIALVAEMPADAQPPAEAGKGIGRAAAAGVQRALAIPHQGSR